MRAALIALGLGLLGSSSLSAPASADCIDYESYLHWTGGATAGACFGVAISGNYAYVVVGQGSNRFKVIDISNPEAPFWIASLDLTWPLGVAVSGKYAYVADESSGLRVISIADPADPRIVGQLATPAPANGVTVSGSLAFVAAREAGLLVVDIGDPRNPRTIGSVDTGYASRVFVGGDYAYVAGSGLRIVDIRDPHNPQIVGAVDMESASDVEVVDTYAFVAASYSGFRVFDVSDPQNPRDAGGVATPGRACAVAVSGTSAYVVYAYGYWERTGVQAIDISDPANSRTIGIQETTDAWDVAVSRDYAYLGTSRGLDVLDISVPESASIIGKVSDYLAGGHGVAVSGPYAYVTGSSLLVVDVADPTTPRVIGSVEAQALDVVVLGMYAYIVDGGGVKVIDISDPQSPTVVGVVDTPGAAIRLAVSGAYAYVADGTSGLQVIDVANPSQPRIVGHVGTNDANSVAISGWLACVGDGNAGLLVVDITDSMTPRIVGQVDTPGWADGVEISGNIAYLADSYGLQVISIANPEVPLIIGTVRAVGYPTKPVVSGEYVYLADTWGGLLVVDAKDPKSPKILGSRSVERGAVGLAVSGDYVYLLDRAGVPWLPQTELTILQAQCVTAGMDGFADITSRSGPHVFPNPTHGEATIRVAMAEATFLTARIFDVTGRLVRDLRGGVVSAGFHDLRWDRRNDAGHEVAPGVYLARLSSRDGVLTSRVVILR